ncbi:glycosyltransferase family A protein [Paenibacillus sp. M1]|uniref:Glycosyltransferase family A protein n=1 Tax=Paenibacillus haidiansis TaxID=1574488 RepID=A0ABU7VSH3_9BACL
MPGQELLRGNPSVTIITCTKRRRCMDTLFRNYSRQNYENKELIVILNHKSLKLDEYIEAAKPYKDVKIYRLPSHVPLGQCLNYGVKMSKHDLIAKFDDDDYYAPGYLTDSVRTLLKTKADIVGKRAHYMELKGKKPLLFRYHNKAEQYVPLVQGATLLVKRHVFNRVRFPAQNRGECVKFCSRSLKKGFKIYAGNPYHFLAVRERNSKDHTWIVSDRKLLRSNVKTMKVTNKRRFVSPN